MVQIWSRNLRKSEQTRPSNSTVWQAGQLGEAGRVGEHVPSVGGGGGGALPARARCRRARRPFRNPRVVPALQTKPEILNPKSSTLTRNPKNES